MKYKTKEAAIDTALNVRCDKNLIIESELRLTTVEKALKGLCSEYFRLPVFQMLNEADIIKPDLALGDLLIYNGWAIQVYEWNQQMEQRVLTHYLTGPGVDYLHHMMYEADMGLEQRLLEDTNKVL